MARTKLVVVMGIVFWFVSGGQGAAAATVSTDEAEALISALQIDALSIISDSTLSPEEAKQRLHGTIERYFNVPWMVRFVLARYWRKATRAQRSEFVQLYKTLTVDSYSRNLAGLSGGNVRILSSKLQAQGRRASVVTETTSEDYPDWKLMIHWVVIKGNTGGPRVIDIVFAGISFIATKRQEFRSAVRQHGGDIEAVISDMRARVSRL